MYANLCSVLLTLEDGDGDGKSEKAIKKTRTKLLIETRKYFGIIPHFGGLR